MVQLLCGMAMSARGLLWVVGVVLVVFLLLLPPTPVHSARHQLRGRLCGIKLVNRLRKICNNNFYTPTPSSRSSVGRIRRAGVRRGGIVEECCMKSCGFSYLTSFCARPPFPPRKTVPATTSTTSTTTPSPPSTSTHSRRGGKGRRVGVKTFRSILHLFHYLRDVLQREMQQKNDPTPPLSSPAPTQPSGGSTATHSNLVAVISPPRFHTHIPSLPPQL